MKGHGDYRYGRRWGDRRRKKVGPRYMADENTYKEIRREGERDEGGRENTTTDLMTSARESKTCRLSTFFLENFVQDVWAGCLRGKSTLHLDVMY